jgi:hypothetical protein
MLIEEKLGAEALEQLIFDSQTGSQIKDDGGAGWAAEVLAACDRSRAVRALSARIAEGTSVEEASVRLLSDLDRTAAVDSLRRLADSGAGFSQVEALLRLAAIDRNAAEKGLAEVITSRSAFDHDRARAARALAEWNPVEAVTLLTESLRRRDHWVSMTWDRTSFDLLVELDRAGAVDLLAERVMNIRKFTFRSDWADAVRRLAELAPGRAESLLRDLSKSTWRRGVRRSAQEMLRELSAVAQSRQQA